ncbi:hypothetical protein DV737_g3527, partial [Chaetothyriales sp. CBS 132003]
MPHYDFLVGTFNTPHIYTLTLTLPSTATISSENSQNSSLTVTKRHDAVGSHSWLHLTPPFNTARPVPAQARGHSAFTRRNLYATAWTEPPSVVAYAVESPTSIKLLGQGRTKMRSGYVTASDRAVYSAGGATGEAISFVDATGRQEDDGSVLDFGGLRHGAHSADLSPDGSVLYVADIGRNAIWSYTVDSQHGKIALAQKLISPRPNDGPRHVWPHPAGKVVYVLQEHTSHVDVFDVAPGPKLQHAQGVRIIPEGLNVQDFWADEVRSSLSDGDRPRWIYASTRGLQADTKGWLAVFAIDADGHVDASTGDKGLVALWETPTSGGWANAVQPGPTVNGIEYLALTDSEEGWVFVISWDGKEIKEVARSQLDKGAGAATAVWL